MTSKYTSIKTIYKKNQLINPNKRQKNQQEKKYQLEK